MNRQFNARIPQILESFPGARKPSLPYLAKEPTSSGHNGVGGGQVRHFKTYLLGCSFGSVNFSYSFAFWASCWYKSRKHQMGISVVDASCVYTSTTRLFN